MSATTAQETCAILREVTDVLTRLGDALVGADLDALLAAEPLLEDLSRTLDDCCAPGPPIARPFSGAEGGSPRVAARGEPRHRHHICSRPPRTPRRAWSAYDREGRSNRPGPSSPLSTRG
jgi:hypothetical protein